MTREEKIKDIEENGMKSRGHKDILNFLKGKKIKGQKGYIRAFCYECFGYHPEPRCKSDLCPLHPVSQFGGRKRSPVETA